MNFYYVLRRYYQQPLPDGLRFYSAKIMIERIHVYYLNQ